MIDPKKRKRCVLRVCAGEKIVDVSKSEKVDERTIQKWMKTDAPADWKAKAAEKAVSIPGKSETPGGAAPGEKGPENGPDDKIEAALGKAGAGQVSTAVSPSEIAAQKSLTLESDTAFCLSSVKTSKAVGLVTAAPIFGISPNHPELLALIELAPHTVETIKANAGPFAAELRKVIGDNLYLVYAALLGETVAGAFGVWTLAKRMNAQRKALKKAAEEHGAAHGKEAGQQ